MKKLNNKYFYFFPDFTLLKTSLILRNLYIAIDIITNPAIILRVEEYYNLVPTQKVCLLYTQSINIFIQYEKGILSRVSPFICPFVCLFL